MMPAHPRQADAALPPEGWNGHWVPSRKEAVCVAILRAELTVADALRRWNISVEELDAWLVAHRRRGRRGLRVSALAGQGRLL